MLAQADLMGYWPLDEQEGFYALDLVSANCLQVAPSTSEGTDGNCLSSVGIHGYLIQSDLLEWKSSDWTEPQGSVAGTSVFRFSDNLGDYLVLEVAPFTVGRHTHLITLTPRQFRSNVPTSGDIQRLFPWWKCSFWVRCTRHKQLEP